MRWFASLGWTLGLGWMLMATAQAGTGLVYHPDFLLHDAGAGHPERPDRLRAIVAHLESTGLNARLTPIEARAAELEWINRVHTPEYVTRLAAAQAHAPVQLDPDTRMAPDSLRIAILATGGVLAAVDAVMAGKVRNAFVAARPPGHHALPDRAMGFCFINHVLVAARYIQAHYRLARVLIVDWDVHHGNGTAAVAATDPSILYFSTHQYPYYPGTGAADEQGEGAARGTVINVPLAAGAGDRELIAAFENQLVPAADAFAPDFVLISAGFDAHRDDPLASLQVSETGYRRLTEIVLDIADRHAAGRVVSVLEGGYDLTALARSVASHIEGLLAHATHDAVPR